MAALIVAVTGASGSIYARAMLKALLSLGHTVHLTVTEPGARVMGEELSWELPAIDDSRFEEALRTYLDDPCQSRLKYYDYRDVGASIASGSVKTDGMIIIPCTMSTLAGICAGTSRNLVERAADVMLKERRPLALVPRETPLNQIHLRNMLELARMGVHIIPAAPAFYGKPQTIEDLADFIVGRVLDLLNIEHSLYRRWVEDCNE